MILNAPVVSVCIQTYNHDDYIRVCLDSILSQKTNFDFEVLLGEDYSDDKTREICIEYSKKYPEIIKLFLHERENVIKINGRATGRYNFMNNLKKANGKYIALCEGDDYWTDSTKLQKQVDYLEANPCVAIAIHRVNLLKESDLELHEVPNKCLGTKFRFIDLIENYNFIATCSVVFKKPEKLTLPDYFSSIPFGDIALYHLLTKNSFIFCLEDTMGVYRIHDGGIWSGISEKQSISDYLLFYTKIFNHLNLEEKNVVKQKCTALLKKLATLQSRNTISRNFYYICLLVKYFKIYV